MTVVTNMHKTSYNMSWLWRCHDPSYTTLIKKQISFSSQFKDVILIECDDQKGICWRKYPLSFFLSLQLLHFLLIFLYFFFSDLSHSVLHFFIFHSFTCMLIFFSFHYLHFLHLSFLAFLVLQFSYLFLHNLHLLFFHLHIHYIFLLLTCLFFNLLFFNLFFCLALSSFFSYIFLIFHVNFFFCSLVF